jgi:hypothetical protein
MADRERGRLIGKWSNPTGELGGSEPSFVTTFPPPSEDGGDATTKRVDFVASGVFDDQRPVSVAQRSEVLPASPDSGGRSVDALADHQGVTQHQPGDRSENLRLRPPLVGMSAVRRPSGTLSSR